MGKYFPVHFIGFTKAFWIEVNKRSSNRGGFTVNDSEIIPIDLWISMNLSDFSFGFLRIPLVRFKFIPSDLPPDSLHILYTFMQNYSPWFLQIQLDCFRFPYNEKDFFFDSLEICVAVHLLSLFILRALRTLKARRECAHNNRCGRFF